MKISCEIQYICEILANMKVNITFFLFMQILLLVNGLIRLPGQCPTPTELFSNFTLDEVSLYSGRDLEKKTYRAGQAKVFKTATRPGRDA